MAHKEQQVLIDLLQERNRELAKMVFDTQSEKFKKVAPDDTESDDPQQIPKPVRRPTMTLTMLKLMVPLIPKIIQVIKSRLARNAVDANLFLKAYPGLSISYRSNLIVPNANRLRVLSVVIILSSLPYYRFFSTLLCMGTPVPPALAVMIRLPVPKLSPH